MRFKLKKSPQRLLNVFLFEKSGHDTSQGSDQTDPESSQHAVRHSRPLPWIIRTRCDGPPSGTCPGAPSRGTSNEFDVKPIIFNSKSSAHFIFYFIIRTQECDLINQCPQGSVVVMTEGGSGLHFLEGNQTDSWQIVFTETKRRGRW